MGAFARNESCSERSDRNRLDLIQPVRIAYKFTDIRIHNGFLTISREFKVGDPMPMGYIERQEWAEVHFKAGIEQVRCGCCNLGMFPQQLSARVIESVVYDRRGRERKIPSPVCVECNKKIVPREYQRKRTKGFRLPAGVVCVTRPGKFGNPFATAEEFEKALSHVINCDNPELDLIGEHWAYMKRIADSLEELRGKDLACWCVIGANCHRTVLIKYANR